MPPGGRRAGPRHLARAAAGWTSRPEFKYLSVLLIAGELAGLRAIDANFIVMFNIFLFLQYIGASPDSRWQFHALHLAPPSHHIRGAMPQASIRMSQSGRRLTLCSGTIGIHLHRFFMIVT
jgi:hypothetical protein